MTKYILSCFAQFLSVLIKTGKRLQSKIAIKILCVSRGVLEVYMTGAGPTELHIANPKNTQACNFRPKKILGIKISNPEKYKDTEHTSLKKSSNEYFSDPLIATKTQNQKFARR